MNPYSIPNDFSATWNGVSVFHQVDIQKQPYTYYSYQVVGTGSDTVAFAFRDYYSYLKLDDVSVVPTPEPSTLVLLTCGAISLLLPYAWQRRRD